MILVTGGSSSGKSAYAESLLTEITYGEAGSGNPAARYYIAAMKVSDDEDRARVAKHRQMREGKGFLTLEQPVDLIEVLDEIPVRACALLECMSNLAANEMFREDGAEAPGSFVSTEPVADRIVRQVAALDNALDDLVVVTNNVFEDGMVYEDPTMEYLRVLGEINRRLAVLADRVIEVVAGIPVVWKESEGPDREGTER